MKRFQYFFTLTIVFVFGLSYCTPKENDSITLGDIAFLLFAPRIQPPVVTECGEVGGPNLSPAGRFEATTTREEITGWERIVSRPDVRSGFKVILFFRNLTPTSVIRFDSATTSIFEVDDPSSNFVSYSMECPFVASSDRMQDLFTRTDPAANVRVLTATPSSPTELSVSLTTSQLEVGETPAPLFVEIQ